MLLDYLPDVWKKLSKLKERIRLINGCSCREEYCYHVLGKRFDFPVERPRVQDRFRVSSIMDEEEHQKIIATGKYPEEFSPRVMAWRERGWRPRGSDVVSKDLERALAKVTTEAGDLCLQNQAEHAQEEASMLSSELHVSRAHREVAIGRASATEEKVLQSWTELIALKLEAEALHACGANLDAREELSRNGEVLVLQEQIIILSSRESELLIESEIMQAEVAQLRTELEMLWAKRLQVGLTQGGDTLSLGLISGLHASVIAEYLWSDIHWRREECKHSHYFCQTLPFSS
ncbi:hypothetical protein ACLOJK_028745 [Asimina triloba]